MKGLGNSQEVNSEFRISREKTPKVWHWTELKPLRTEGKKHLFSMVTVSNLQIIFKCRVIFTDDSENIVND